MKNESGPHIFHAWSPVNELTGRIRRCVLAGGLSVGVGFDISKTYARPNVSPPLLVNLIGFLSYFSSPYLPACPLLLPCCHGLTSETVRKPSYMLPL